MSRPACSGPCNQGRRACSCPTGRVQTPAIPCDKGLDLNAPARARPRRGPVSRRLAFVLQHPTLATYALVAALIGAWVLASAWDQQALLALAGASA